jgi:hypothetical protein
VNKWYINKWHSLNPYPKSRINSRYNRKGCEVYAYKKRNVKRLPRQVHARIQFKPVVRVRR